MSRQPPLNRRQFLSAALGSTAAAAAALAVCPPLFGESRKPPNIILIMADDLGYGDLSCYGNKTFETKHLDQLAEEGLRFTDFHSNGAVCSPTRAALLTGRYQQRCGIEGVVTAKSHRDTGMALSETTFAEVLSQAGYATALFGKWHLGYDVGFNPTKQGFDHFRGYVSGNVDYHSHIDQTGVEDWWSGTEKHPEEGYSTDLVTDYAIEFIENHRNVPFCLYLPHEAPHYPYQGRNDKPDRKPGSPDPVHGSREDRTGAYQEMIQAMDEGVGRVVETVKRLGLAQDTFIFFCSDNGAAKVGSCGPLRGNKGSLWEGGHRVPAIAWGPGRVPEGGVTHETVMAMDLFPTMAALAGAKLPADPALDGADFSPLFRGGTLGERTLFWRFKGQKAVRSGPWKLVVESRKGASPAYLLFNLDDDLAEQHDCSASHPEVLGRLKMKLAAWEGEVGTPEAMRS